MSCQTGDWLLALVDAIALDARIHFDAQLSVFRKAWMSLSGVHTDLAGEVAPDTVLMEADLAAAMTAGWFTGARYWQRAWTKFCRVE